ncbi:CDP-diacylglycerol--glycerol-3-phosphate 3-phosphatidyltransferase [Teratosphaeriaceae sp. CCFEE 6253]|nr:CDP-diacylglycerol--glycerol-3-phosphate 3-phosphatidyltransferase [Teratosphaeriaceae sp. CCFEE 6253]
MSSFASADRISSSASPLASINSELDKLTPRFDVSADSIEIIKSPVDFYEALKNKIAKARRSIYLSTLYVGKTEYDFVGLTKLLQGLKTDLCQISTIHSALEANPELTVSILTDYLRGTREAPDASCASLLASLVTDFPERVEIRLFHTPNLTGVRKAILPKRINEGWGLQHMKLYGVDDEIIMSGANLSDDYFTNRQDRYHVIKSREVTDFFARVYRTVADLSYRVLPSETKPGGFEVDWPKTNVQPAPLDDPKGYIAAATKVLAPFTRPSAGPIVTEKGSDTQIYPVLQLTPLLKPDSSTELPALTGVLRHLSTPALAGSKWTFTAGYFNMTPEVRRLLLDSQPASATIIAASPWANGFYGSKGVSGMLPAAYTYLSRRFLTAVASAGLGQQITLKEWRRGTVNTPGGWTYHAKGVWITLPGQQEVGPSISLVGSSNYTKRSYSLDLEANALIVTTNKGLQRRLGEEEKWLQEYAKPVTQDDFAKTERRVGLHVRVAMWIVSIVGGAL